MAWGTGIQFTATGAVRESGVGVVGRESGGVGGRDGAFIRLSSYTCMALPGLNRAFTIMM